MGFVFFVFSIFFLCLFINSLIMMCLGMNFIGLLIPFKVHQTSCSYRFMFFIKLGKFSASISSNIFFFFLHHILSALFLGARKWNKMLNLPVLSHRSLKFCSSFFQLFSLCCSICMNFYWSTFKFIDAFFVISIPLLFLYNEFLTCYCIFQFQIFHLIFLLLFLKHSFQESSPLLLIAYL